MSAENNLDPRARLVREKYFSLRPKPLERWLWQQSLPQTAERVFWLHWEEGMRSGDWCSEIPVRRVATLCCVDPSSVTRAYQMLKTLGLIRRADPGRDPANPFQQATAVTEVRVPPALLAEIGRHPNRRALARPQAHQPTDAVDATIDRNPIAPAQAPGGPSPTTTGAPEGPASAPTQHLPRPTRQSQQALWSRASDAEKGRFFAASRGGQTQMAFDARTRLSAEDQAQWLAQLVQMARPATTSPRAPLTASPVTSAVPRRRLSPLELARARKQISLIVPANQLSETFRQVIWAVEEGALSKFEWPLALNIALKKLREGAWTRPNRMPPNWMRHAAHAELCSAA
jgi:hypothetical protein